MRRTLRAILGFLGAPLAPQFFIFTTSIKHGYVGQMRDIAWYTLLVSLALTALCLLPSYLLLQRRARVLLRDYLWMGAKSGMIAGMVLAVIVEGIGWYLHLPDRLRPETPIAIGVLGAMLMVMLCAVFWLIARPDLNPVRVP